MADNWTTFSEVLPRLTPDEETWIRQQLDPEALADEARRSQLSWQPEDEFVNFEWSIDDDHNKPDGWDKTYSFGQDQYKRQQRKRKRGRK